MKKQLLIGLLSVCVTLPAFAIVGKKQPFGKHKGLMGAQRKEYQDTFKLINETAGKLSETEKKNLIHRLTAYFNGLMSGIELNQKEAQDIYKNATQTFDDLKKLEQQRSKLIGTEGKRRYSPSLHFAQKVLGSILLPNPMMSISSAPRTRPVGPEKGRVKMNPRGPVRTSPALPINKGGARMNPNGPVQTSPALPLNKGPQSGTTRAILPR
jgi:hypothetical protein